MVGKSLRRMTGVILTVAATIFAAPVVAQDSCDSVLAAETSAGAMVRLSLSSTCHAGQNVVIHHNGMMVSAKMDDTGMLMLAIPALSETAMFMAEFSSDGTVSVATVEVPALSFYDRVALLWQGDFGLQLHAREFGGDYGSKDHVWRDSPRSMDSAALGEGGFIVELGDGTIKNGYHAEVYTFPSATVSRAGDVLMSVEAEVDQANCDKDIEAETIQVKSNGDPVVRDLKVTMPSCDNVGDILIFDSLVDDIKNGSK